MKLIFYIKTTDVGETKKYSNNTSVDPDFDNGSPKSEIRWEQRLQQPMLGGYEHNSGGCCTIGKFHCNR